MTIEEMRDHLTKIQNESFQTKILNAILTCYAETKNQEQAIVEMQNKINEIISILNSGKKNAETVNFQSDALPEQPAPQKGND